jgi:hypothetical protein
MGLELYDKYTARVSLGACEGDDLGAHQPEVLEEKLRALEEIADEGYIDGWMDYLNPKQTFEENRAILEELADVDNNGCATCGVNHDHTHSHDHTHDQGVAPLQLEFE